MKGRQVKGRRGRNSRLVAGMAFIGVTVTLEVGPSFLPSGWGDAVRTAVEYTSAVLGLVLAGPDVLERLRNWRNPPPVDTLADLSAQAELPLARANRLARAVRSQWEKEAFERGLKKPAPIPVRWSLSHLKGARPVEAAVGDPNTAPTFRPLPGQCRVTEDQLRAGGGLEKLFAVYGGIASGRVAVIGEPGAGKSGTAILLLLDALEHREQVKDTAERVRVPVPVPVLFTTHGWDPVNCSVRDWLATQLAATYSMFQNRGGHAEAAELIDGGGVALILDGLDEMGEAVRGPALEALSDATFRVVVLTRSQEVIQAGGTAHLAGGCCAAPARRERVSGR